MVDLSEQKATFSPIKRPHGLIYSQLCWTFTGPVDTDQLSEMDTHLGGAVSTLGHVYELYFVFCCS